MKLLDILGKVGGAVVKNVVPGGGLLVDLVNEFLPADKKLADRATGEEVRGAVDSLPPEQRAQLLSREFDVQLEQHHTLQTMLQAEQASGKHTTRPKIAYGAFQVVAFATVMIVGLWAYAVAAGDDAMVDVVVNGWPFVLAVLGPLVVLLHAYFGVLKTEQRDRLNAANGSTGGALSSIINYIAKKR